MVPVLGPFCFAAPSFATSTGGGGGGGAWNVDVVGPDRALAERC